MSDFANTTIRSWDDFNDYVLNMNPTGSSQGRPWLYRGQSKDWKLVTKIERVLNNWDIDPRFATDIELQTIREFRRRQGEPEYQRVHNDTLFCLALMQHHGAPTRLLDCTYSPFVAAAFAMEEGFSPVADPSNQPVIWCFRAAWCEAQAKEAIKPEQLVERRNDDRQRTDETFLQLYQLGGSIPLHPARHKFVKFENPFYLNERLTTQQGVFLCPADLGSSFLNNLKAMPGWDCEDNVVKL